MSATADTDARAELVELARARLASKLLDQRRTAALRAAVDALT